MNRHTGMMQKFFIAFLFVGALALLLTGVQMYCKAKESIMGVHIKTLESVRNIKKRQIEDHFSFINRSLSVFSGRREALEALKELSSAFENMGRSLPEEVVDQCKSELLTYYSDLRDREKIPEAIKNVSPEELIPVSPSGVAAQCVLIDGAIGDKTFLDFLKNDKNVLEYLEKRLRYGIIFDGFRERWSFIDVLLLNDKGDIVYTSGKMIDTGRNIREMGRLAPRELEEVLYSYGGNGSGVKFSDFYPYYPAEGIPLMIAASPVASGEDLPAGVMAGIMDSSVLDRILSGDYGWKDEGFGITGDAYIAGYDGMLKSNPRKFLENPENYLKSFRNNAIDNESRETVLRTGVAAYFIPAPANEGEVFGKTGSGIFKEPEAEAVITAYAPLDIPGLNWEIFSRISLDEMKNDMVSLQISILRAGLLVFIIVLAFTAILSMFFTRPLRTLQESFLRIAEGDFSVRVSLNRNDELQDLARSFNSMADRLHSHDEKNAVITKMLEDEVEERSAAEAALMDERDFIATVLDSKGILVVVVDSEDKIVRVNGSISEMFGEKYGPGDDYKNIVPEKYRSQLTDIAKNLRAKGGSPYLFSKSAAKNGKEIFVDWTFSLVEGRDPGKRFIAAIGIDVTERYRAQEYLRENEEMLQMIMSHAQDAIVISDNENRVMIMNDAAEKMLERSFKELKGRAVIPNLIPEEYEGEFLDNIQRGKTLEIYARRKNGDRFPVELSVSKVKFRGHWNTLYILRDSSVRKKRETELYKALEKAKSAEKAKSEFLANMSHEIRTPLNGVVGFLSLLKQTELDESQLEYLRIVDASMESLLNIINDILDFSKIESGKMTLESLDFNCRDLFEQAAELYSAKALEKNLELILDVDPRAPEWLTGDPLRLKQILSNLLSNAVKFTEKGGRIIIKASLEDLTETSCSLRISVKDTGIGISPEKRSAIFGMFSQADSSVTRKYGGSGLGLAICARLVRLMGSNLQLISEEGEGSEFYFTAAFSLSIKRHEERLAFAGTAVAFYDCPNKNCLFKRASIDYFEMLKCVVKPFKTAEELNEMGEFDVIYIGYRQENDEIFRKINEKFPEAPKIVVLCDSEKGGAKFFDSPNSRTIPRPVNLTKVTDALAFLLHKSLGGEPSLLKEPSEDAVFKGEALVVEDNLINRRLAEIMLTKCGLNVSLASDGREALKMFREHKYDIIFMDIHMPVMDGVTATEEILRAEKASGSSHTPIIALTANVIKEDRETYRKAGMDGFLAKPIEKEKLEEILKRFLNENNSGNFLEKLSGFLEIPNMDVVKNTVTEYYKFSLSQIRNMRKAAEEGDMKKLSSLSASSEEASLGLMMNETARAARALRQAAEKNDVFAAVLLIEEIEKSLLKVKDLTGL